MNMIKYTSFCHYTSAFMRSSLLTVLKADMCLPCPPNGFTVTSDCQQSALTFKSQAVMPARVPRWWKLFCLTVILPASDVYLWFFYFAMFFFCFSLKSKMCSHMVVVLWAFLFFFMMVLWTLLRMFTFLQVFVSTSTNRNVDIPFLSCIVTFCFSNYDFFFVFSIYNNNRQCLFHPKSYIPYTHYRSKVWCHKWQ